MRHRLLDGQVRSAGESRAGVDVTASGRQRRVPEGIFGLVGRCGVIQCGAPGPLRCAVHTRPQRRTRQRRLTAVKAGRSTPSAADVCLALPLTHIVS